MDNLLHTLADFVGAVDPQRIPPTVTKEVIRHTLDTVGCGAGGLASSTMSVVREVSQGVTGPMVASTYGSEEKVLIDFAALVNGTANRYLDFNDFGTSGHPSDMISAILAVAEASGASGRDVVAGVYIAYEIASTLAEAVPKDLPWDQGIFCALGVAGAASKILGLDQVKTRHALSLAAVPNVSMRVTRFGELSAWKASAAPYACMQALTAVRLAAAGMAGPSEPFEGNKGIFENVWPAFELHLTPDFSRPTGIERSSLKQYGACYWAQVGVDLIHGLRRGIDLNDISSIEIDTCHTAWFVIGGGSGDAAQRWRPQTRETADHSLPFLMATMLADGEIGEQSFSAARLKDESFLSLVAKISVSERTDLTARATRDTCPTEVRITLTSGELLTDEREFPKGHPMNPMDDDEVIEKFREFVGSVLPARELDSLQRQLLQLPELNDLELIGDLLRKFKKNVTPVTTNNCQTLDTV